MSQLTVEQASALLAAEPFMIVSVLYREADDAFPFHAAMRATNISNEHCLDELISNLDFEVDTVLNSVPNGYSTYLCQMKFAESYIEYSGWETAPFWEIVSYELIGTEPIVLEDE